MLTIDNICYRIRMLTISNTEGQLLTAIGGAVKARRIAMGIGVGELAQRVACSRYSIINLERGHKAVSVVVFVRVCIALNLNVLGLSEGACDEDTQPGSRERRAKRERRSKTLASTAQVEEPAHHGEEGRDDHDRQNTFGADPGAQRRHQLKVPITHPLDAAQQFVGPKNHPKR